jgi:hypothetical protein
MMEKKCFVKTMVMLLAFGAMGSANADKFDSGSTGLDGAFDPETSITLELPESGIYNFTNVNIREGVTVFFSRNGANTPVVIRATGDVNIAGTIDISGKSAAPIKGGTGANFPEGGIGGPGGFNGGRGGDPGGGPGGSGQGVGGGMGGSLMYTNGYTYAEGGGGAGYLTAGGASYQKAYSYGGSSGVGGASHGSNTVLPVLGGSGGGGGGGAAAVANGSTGGGGGGGGGAILIAATGKFSLSGAILARGGRGGIITPSTSGSLEGGEGGGGSGGMIRILASSFQTGGTLDVSGGVQASSNTYHRSGTGSYGRTSTETMLGGTLSLSGLPVLAISRIGGVDVPAHPTGTADVGLPLSLTNPVPVQLVAQNVPLNATVKLMMVPVYGGNSVTVDAAALSGSLENSTTTASIDLPNGPSMLTAFVTYSVNLAMGEALSTYAMGERVEKVTLAAAPGQETQAILTTVSGREFKIHPSVLMMMSAV